jgi:hypothetical protein
VEKNPFSPDEPTTKPDGESIRPGAKSAQYRRETERFLEKGLQPPKSGTCRRALIVVAAITFIVGAAIVNVILRWR